MELNSTGSIARFYCWSYGLHFANLPPDFCMFFWKLLLALLVLPVTVWTLLPQKILRLGNLEWSLGGRFLAGNFTALLIAVAVHIVTAIASAPYESFTAILKILSAIAVVTALLAAGIYVSNSRLKNEFAEIAKTKTSSVKDKYCPKINWK